MNRYNEFGLKNRNVSMKRLEFLGKQIKIHLSAIRADEKKRTQHSLWDEDKNTYDFRPTTRAFTWRLCVLFARTV